MVRTNVSQTAGAGGALSWVNTCQGNDSMLAPKAIQSHSPYFQKISSKRRVGAVFPFPRSNFLRSQTNPERKILEKKKKFFRALRNWDSFSSPRIFLGHFLSLASWRVLSGFIQLASLRYLETSRNDFMGFLLNLIYWIQRVKWLHPMQEPIRLVRPRLTGTSMSTFSLFAICPVYSSSFPYCLFVI